MPAPDQTSFTVHVDPDALAREELAAVPLPAVAPSASAGIFRAAGDHPRAAGSRDAARRSDGARAPRAAGAGRSRSYAFRRS